jgi:hypothetical protein
MDPMLPFRTQREFPAPSLIVFVALQVLDILSTILGLCLGASESSVFISGLMRMGPFQALLLSKILAVFLVATALKLHRPRLVVFLNYWFAAVVTWNLAMVLIVELGRR